MSAALAGLRCRFCQPSIFFPRPALQAFLTKPRQRSRE
jgi:hypothetical protein